MHGCMQTVFICHANCCSSPALIPLLPPSHTLSRTSLAEQRRPQLRNRLRACCAAVQEMNGTPFSIDLTSAPHLSLFHAPGVRWCVTSSVWGCAARANSRTTYASACVWPMPGWASRGIMAWGQQAAHANSEPGCHHLKAVWTVSSAQSGSQ